jgi:hypothetical protein
LSPSAAATRTGAAFIEPGSPWENAFVESFNSRVRDELLAVEVFSCLTEAKVMVEDFRQDYNHHRPHRAHQMMTPAVFAEGWRTAHEAARASADLHSPIWIAGLRQLLCGCHGGWAVCCDDAARSPMPIGARERRRMWSGRGVRRLIPYWGDR